VKIKLQEALDLIEAADTVKLTDGDGVILPQIFVEGLCGEPTNEVMYVSWEDERDEFGFRVCEGDNLEVEREGHKLTLIDSEGEPFELQLFREVPILV
jgi:hypothetical protein